MRFSAAFTVRAPLERVLKLYQSPEALRQLTPPLVAVHVIAADPLGEGSGLEFDLALPLVPRSVAAIRWRARHSDFESEFGADKRLIRHAFADSMEVGPLAAWRHVHTFSRTEGDDTHVADTIDYEHHDGVQSWPARAAFNNNALSCLFAWRALATRFLLRGPVR